MHGKHTMVRHRIFNNTAYVKDFSDKFGCELTIQKGGEHWFHTEEQMKFLDEWIVENSKHNDRFSRATCVR